MSTKRNKYIDLEKLYNRFVNGESLRKMAPEFNLHYTSLSARLKKAGFEIEKRYLNGSEHPGKKCHIKTDNYGGRLNYAN